MFTVKNGVSATQNTKSTELPRFIQSHSTLKFSQNKRTVGKFPERNFVKKKCYTFTSPFCHHQLDFSLKIMKKEQWNEMK